MSTQLILYPQTYQGQINSTATPVLNQFVVNGINFTGLNTTTLYNTTAGSPSQDAILNSSPSILGNWYRFTTTGSPWGNVTAPAVASNNLVLSYSATLGHTGIYQQLSGLIVGSIYEVTINISTTAVGILTLETYTGNVIQHNESLSSATAQIITTFTAQSTNDIFLIDFSGTASALTISSISITESGTSASLIYSELNDGQVICDLYQEEDIPLTLSIDDFKNVAEQVKSYSKDFNLPATKRNNQIFNNMFEVTRTAHNTLEFNPYVRTQCVLKQDGFILFEGYLRMMDVKDKEGEISYNVNLYSEVIALADILKDSTFATLDFTELTHDYNRTQIEYSWNDSVTGITYTNPSTSGFRDAYSTLKYPFIDWTHQYLIGGTGSGTLATDGNPELTSLEQAFRPCIQLKYLINKIFAASGFNWTSDFFDSADFGKLYMDFNWGSNEFASEVGAASYGGSQGGVISPTIYSTTSYAAVPFDYTTFDSAMGWDSANSRLVATYDYQAYIMQVAQFQPVFLSGQTLETRWAHYNSLGVLLNTYNVASQSVAFGTLSPPLTTPLTTMILQSGDYIQFEWKTNTAGEGEMTNNQYSVILGTTGSLQTTTSTILQTLRGELGQWDFLKGIMTMFNLVSLIDENDPNNILIEPYSDVFINNTNCSTTTSGLTLACRSIQHDWTDKVDVSEMELKPLTDLNKETIFKFVEDDDDYAFNVFKQAQSGHLYGSLKHTAATSSQNLPTLLQGTKEIIAEPFAATVSKPIDPQFSSFIIPSLYAMNDDGTTEGFDNSPRIFYNNGIKDTGASYYMPAQNGVTSDNETNFLQFSHLSDIPTIAGSRDFVFKSSQLVTEVGAPPADNLYSIYWQPYFNELYNADTRTMTLKVNLSASDVASFKFYDTVFIKNRSFRVNKIDYKPNELATVEFILIP